MKKVVAQTLKSTGLAHSQLMQVILGCLMLFICSQIYLPLKPVPITLQTVAVLVIGLFYNRSTAIQSVLLYLGLGAVGIPIFAKFMSGYSYMFGPTGGYMLGFLLAVIVMTTLRQKFTESKLFNFINASLGLIIIYLCGISWLAHLIGWEKAFNLGLVPFIIPGIIKTALLVSVVNYMKS